MMRLYETTAVVQQRDACIPQRHACVQSAMKMMRAMAVILLAIGVVTGVATLRLHIAAGLLTMLLFGVIAVIMMPVGRWSARRTAANYYPDGDGQWTSTTWFESDGIHRTDDEGDEDVFPVSRLVCGYRAGNVLLLCAKSGSVLPINLEQLSETDRKSVFERIKTECPAMKMVQI